MHKIEQKIVKLFRENPDSEFSTKDIVLEIYPQATEEQSAYDFGDKKEIAMQKNRIAKLHRTVLYHIKKLVDDELLIVSRVGLKGRKYFMLNLREGEELSYERNRRRFLFSKPHAKAMPIEGYESTGLVHRFEPESWISRVNSILIQSDKLGLRELHRAIVDCFSHVNDVICLNDFEMVIQEHEYEEIEKFFIDLAHDCEDYGRNVTITIDVKNIKNEKPVLEFVKKVAEYKGERIHIIFDTKAKQMQDTKNFFENIAGIFAETKTKLYLKNKDLHNAPYMLGRAGPYTFSERDWRVYRDYNLSQSYGVLCGSSTIVVDVKRFFEQVGRMDDFRKMISNALKALFLANSMQRANSQEYFRNLLKLNPEAPTEFFSTGRNYIRFWNYGWKQRNMDQQIVINLIESTKKEVKEFSLTQEAIYLACGMPTQFKTAFSCAFGDFTNENISKEDFGRTTISNIEELYKGRLNKSLKTKEVIGKIFDGGDRARIVRLGQKHPSEIVRELDIVMNLYNIPLLCYDFGETVEGNLKLTSFI